MDRRSSPHIASVGKAFSLLTLIIGNAGMSAKDLAESTGMPLPSMYRMLNTLISQGVLVKERRGYRLGSAVGLFAEAYAEQGEPVEVLDGPLRELAAGTGETAYLSAWRRGEIEVVAIAHGSHAVRVMQFQHGLHRFAHARASGKLLLAFAHPARRARYLAGHGLRRLTPHTIDDPAELDRELRLIRERGYATDVEEFSLDVSCVAAPVLSAGRVVAAYTVSSPATRFERMRDQLVAETVAAGRRGAAILTGDA